MDATVSKKNAILRWVRRRKITVGTLVATATLTGNSVSYTSANRNNGAEQHKLWHGEEQAKFGDATYTRKADKQTTREQGLYYGMADKGAHKHPLSNSQQKKNRKHASLRAIAKQIIY